MWADELGNEVYGDDTSHFCYYAFKADFQYQMQLLGLNDLTPSAGFCLCLSVFWFILLQTKS